MIRQNRHLTRLLKSAALPGTQTAVPSSVVGDADRVARWKQNKSVLDNPPEQYKTPGIGETYRDVTEELATPTTGASRDNWTKNTPMLLKPFTYAAGGVADMAKAVVRTPLTLAAGAGNSFGSAANNFSTAQQNASQGFYDNQRQLIQRQLQLDYGLSGERLQAETDKHFQQSMQENKDNGWWEDMRRTGGKGLSQIADAATRTDDNYADAWDTFKGGVKNVFNDPRTRGVGNYALGSLQSVGGVASAIPMVGAAGRASGFGRYMNPRAFAAGEAGGLTASAISGAAERVGGGFGKHIANILGAVPRSKAMYAYDDIAAPALGEITGRDLTLPGLARGAFGTDRTFGAAMPTTRDFTPQAAATRAALQLAQQAAQTRGTAPASSSTGGINPQMISALLASILPGMSGGEQQAPQYDNSALGRAARGV